MELDHHLCSVIGFIFVVVVVVVVVVDDYFKVDEFVFLVTISLSLM